MWELVERRAQASPDHPMLIDGTDRILTFGEFRQQVENVAAGLLDHGIGSGTVVSWQLPTQIDTVVLSMALSRLDAVQNPIIHLYREREVGFAVRQTQPKMLVVPGAFRGFEYDTLANRIAEALPDPPAVLSLEGGLPKGDPDALPAPPTATDGTDAPVRWIYYTSGSTAAPKGVRHTDQTLIAGGWGLAKALDMSAEDVGSMAFPYAHISGPDYLVSMLVLGFPAVLIEAWSPPEALAVFRRHGVTMAGGSTAFYLAFLAEQRAHPDEPILPTLRVMSGGGAPKPPEIHYEVRDEVGGRGAVHGLGMTECPMISMGSPHDTDEQLANTDGAPVEGCEVRVVTLRGEIAGPGVEGELRVRGPMLFRGYTDPELDKEAFDQAGYFRTGDLGCVREDGHVVVTGRLKDVIVRKGENISAKEIEDVLYTHPDIADVAVVGLPETARGEIVCAVIQPAQGTKPLTLEDLAAFCKEHGLMTQKIPEQLEIRNEMPRAATGKIVKKALRQEYKADPPEGRARA